MEAEDALSVKEGGPERSVNFFGAMGFNNRYQYRSNIIDGTEQAH
jgi:hypothetical protein